VNVRGALDTVDDRRTPDDLFEECCNLAGVHHFDLDPAATNESARGTYYYDLEADGLVQDWFGNVWLNPPYSDLQSWVAKAFDSDAEAVVMLLPANRTEKSWWQDLVEPGIRDGSVRAYFLRGRRRFNRPGWTAPAKGDRPPFGLVVIVARPCA
jgi:phage N-6-adenine-methyltransferase